LPSDYSFLESCSSPDLPAQEPSQDIAGRWTGTADTTDEAVRSDRNGKAGLKVDVQQAGTKVNLYVYLDFEGGEPLRWKLELKDGSLTGTFSAQHHNPAKWIYDRVGAITITKEK
jgi:hypothetical protein